MNDSKMSGSIKEEVLRTLPVMCYAEIAEINAEHEVFLVRHITSGRIGVRKRLPAAVLPVYEYLKKTKPVGIPRIYELCRENETLTVIEEFIPGKSLREYLKDHGPMKPVRAAFCTAVLASILEPLHRSNPPLIHRDIKPENVIFADSGCLYLVDFGASIFAREGRKRDTNLLGTPGYAAPEQYGYAPSSPGTDVYGLGMVFYEMVGRSREKDVPVRLRIVMKKATSALPENRFRNAGELKTALLSCLSPHLVLTFLAGEHYRRFINRIHKRKEKKKK